MTQCTRMPMQERVTMTTLLIRGAAINIERGLALPGQQRLVKETKAHLFLL